MGAGKEHRMDKSAIGILPGNIVEPLYYRVERGFRSQKCCETLERREWEYRSTTRGALKVDGAPVKCSSLRNRRAFKQTSEEILGWRNTTISQFYSSSYSPFFLVRVVFPAKKIRGIS